MYIANTQGVLVGVTVEGMMLCVSPLPLHQEVGEHIHYLYAVVRREKGDEN